MSRLMHGDVDCGPCGNERVQYADCIRVASERSVPTIYGDATTFNGHTTGTIPTLTRST